MDRQSVIVELKKRVNDLSKSKPRTEIAFEYEAAGTECFTVIAYQGLEAHRYRVRLWSDSDGRVFGKCSCGSERCEHLLKTINSKTDLSREVWQ